MSVATEFPPAVFIPERRPSSAPGPVGTRRATWRLVPAPGLRSPRPG